MQIIKKNFFNILIFMLIFSLDRLTKFLVINEAEKISNERIFESTYINLELIWNEGIAFGLFSFGNDIYYNSLTILICLIIIIIIWLLVRSSGFEKIGFLMIIGGSLGNLFDRLFYSAVPDFIDFHYNNFHWFIFNVADIFITLGVMLLIFLELFTKKKL